MGEVIKLDLDKEEPIEQFEHDGITVTISQSRVTRRFIGRFEDVRPTRFQTTAMQLEDVKRKAIKLIDTLHGKSR